MQSPPDPSPASSRRSPKSGQSGGDSRGASGGAKDKAGPPTPAQRAWLMRGLDQAGGKLPLFDHDGQQVSERTVRSCIERGWAEPWFSNPLKPDWIVCKLTDSARKALKS